jgi:hypothetical protein
MSGRFRTIAIASAAALIAASLAAWAAQTNYLGTVFVADPTTLTNQLKVNADGSINVSTTGGTGSTVAISQATPGSTNNVTVSPLPAAARHFPGCTVGATSTTCLAGATAVTYLQIQNTSLSAQIACAFGTTAVLNSSTSAQLAPGQSGSWGPNTAGVPTGALNCIASTASTPLYVEWN